jgi:hypothetical protein
MTSDPFARYRIRKVLVAVILATIPCYFAGAVAALLAPGRGGQTSGTPTPTSSLTPVVFATRTLTITFTPLPPTGSITPSLTTSGISTGTVTSTPTITPTPTMSTTPTPSNTPFQPPPTYTPTSTPQPTMPPSPTRTNTPTEVPSPTSTYTMVPSLTLTPTSSFPTILPTVITIPPVIP